MAMTNAPSVVAAIPNPETAPEVPASTGFIVVIIRGGVRDNAPNSVAQVSALAAARAAQNPIQVKEI